MKLKYIGIAIAVLLIAWMIDGYPSIYKFGIDLFLAVIFLGLIVMFLEFGSKHGF